MAATFSTTALGVGPVLRSREALLADAASAQVAASGAARARIAEVELTIRDADDDQRRGAYDAALRGYQKAQGLVFRLLHPRFDLGQWLADTVRVALPTGQAVENGLLAVSSQLLGVLRPEALDVTTLPIAAAADLDPALVKFTRAGFHREVAADERLEVAGRQALALLADAKPHQAVPLLQAALAEADQGATPLARASSQLNLAVALLQTGATGEGRAQAAAAEESFSAAGDQAGVAQALHAQAVAAHAAGDEQAATDLFARAATALGPADEVALNPQPLPPDPPPERIGRGRRLGPIAGRRLVPVRERVGDAHLLANVLGAGGVANLAVEGAANAFALGGLNARSPELTDAVRARDVGSLAVRIPGQVDGWQVLPAPDDVERTVAGAAWRVGVPVGTGLVDLAVKADAAPAVATLAAQIYARRPAAGIDDLRLVSVDAASTSTYLTQLYSYALPVKIGDAQHELGLFEAAEGSYLRAAGYTYLNTTVEATALWIRLARNAVEWGNSLYQAEDAEGAKAQYGKLVGEDLSVPAGSALYDLDALATPAGEARELIGHLADRPLPPVQWEIGGWILSALSFLRQLADGLDYHGLLFSPIHTFEYLQSVARGYAQQAIAAEREYVNFRSRQQVEEATRRDLAATSALAHAEADGRREQYLASTADVTAARAARDLAVRRRDDAIRQRDAYAASSWTQIWSQAASTAQGMGSDSWFNEISELADKLDRGESIHGERGKLAAAYTLQAGRRNREYELAKMADTIAELQRSVPIAEAQLSSAQHAAEAAEIAWQAALQRAQLADAALQAFDRNEFTPQAWSSMADVMRDISRGYLWRAIRIAKLMERAFNFENDTSVTVVRAEYGYAVVNAGGSDAVLLGGDALLADVESFTYMAITNARRKRSRIKDAISLARDFPAQFQQFRQTGRLSFETDLYEFDRLHPGFHQQRVDAVEVEFVGLVPEEGLNGTLSAGGTTRFRTRDGEVGRRVHQIDTLALSDFQLRNDAFVYASDTGVRGLFQGIGLGGTWELVLPRRSNDFDFARIVDVRLVVYYTAAFDAGLRTAVLQRAPRPGELSAVRDFNLRYDAPDAWYGFYRNRATDFVLDAARLPANQQEFAVVSVQVRVQTRPGLDPNGIALEVAVPGRPAAALATDADGVADLTQAAPGVAGASPLGTWHLALADDTPVDQVVSIQLGLEYSFSYPDEEV